MWPTKNRCFRCGNPKHHDPVSPGPVIGPTGGAPQKMPATNPTYRRDGRQNKFSGQHVPSVVPPRQSPGVRVDLVRELLSHLNGKSLRSIRILLTNFKNMARS